MPTVIKNLNFQMLKSIETILKICSSAAIVFLIFAIFWSPNLILRYLDRLVNEFHQKDYQVEISFLGIKASREDKVYESLKDADNKILMLEALVSCLRQSMHCTNEQKSKAATIATKLDDLGVAVGKPYIRSSSVAWIVIAGADKTTEDALVELQRLKDNGFSADLVFVDGWFRTVAVFGTSDDAGEALPRIRAAMERPDAYVRLLAEWCTDHVRTTRSDVEVVECKKTWR